MNIWRNQNFPACDKATSDHDKTPFDAICQECGWMFSDHKKDVKLGKILFYEAAWLCPNSPKLPGYPRVEKWSWATEQQQYLSEIKELKRQVSEVSKWNMDLQKQRNESDFRINNLLNQQSKSTHEACAQQKKIKQLESELEVDDCNPTRFRLEDQIRELRNKFRCPDGMVCGICKTCAYENVVSEIKQLKKQLSEAQKRDTYASYEVADRSRKDLIKTCDELRKELDNSKVRAQGLLEQELDIWNKWEASKQEIERLKVLLTEQALSTHRNKDLVRELEIKLTEKELEEDLKSKTINIHNHYQSPSKWEPIETAPRLGLPLLLSRTDSNLPEVGYHSQNGGWKSYSGQKLKPTHWMPLPQAPQ